MSGPVTSAWARMDVSASAPDAVVAMPAAIPIAAIDRPASMGQAYTHDPTGLVARSHPEGGW